MFSWVQGALTGMGVHRHIKGGRPRVELPGSAELELKLNATCKAHMHSQLSLAAGLIFLDEEDATLRRAKKR